MKILKVEYGKPYGMENRALSQWDFRVTLDTVLAHGHPIFGGFLAKRSNGWVAKNHLSGFGKPAATRELAIANILDSTAKEFAKHKQKYRDNEAKKQARRNLAKDIQTILPKDVEAVVYCSNSEKLDEKPKFEISISDLSKGEAERWARIIYHEA